MYSHPDPIRALETLARSPEAPRRKTRPRSFRLVPASSQAPEKFVELDPEIAKTLLDQKDSGKQLLLITNSDYAYTNRMMSYACERAATSLAPLRARRHSSLAFSHALPMFPPPPPSSPWGFLQPGLLPCPPRSVVPQTTASCRTG